MSPLSPQHPQSPSSRLSPIPLTGREKIITNRRLIPLTDEDEILLKRGTYEVHTPIGSASDSDSDDDDDDDSGNDEAELEEVLGPSLQPTPGAETTTP